MSASPGRVSLTVAMATVFAVAACSGGSSNSPSTSASGGTSVPASASNASTAKTASRSPSRVNVTQVPTELKATAAALYEGRPVIATGPAAAPLTKRKASSNPVTVTANLGIWQKTPIAVLSAGKDATLAVKGQRGWQIVGGWWPSMGVTGPYLGGRRHVLFIGSDARTERGQNLLRTNADALQLVGVDGKGGAGVMGMARDLWVPIAGRGSGKINAALAMGGPETQQRTVANVTGIPVQGYVLTGMKDFSALISELGGLTIDSPMRVRDVPKGRSRVFGPDALWYARERKTVPNGDFGRSANQGFLLYSMALQVRAGGAKGLVTTLTKASPRVHTNLTAAQALTLGAWVYRIDATKVGRSVAKGPIGTSSTGASIVVLGPEARAIFGRFRDGNLS